MKKIEIERRLYSVVSPEEYSQNKSSCNAKTTAVLVGETVLPIRSSIENSPGVYYNNGCETMADVIKPSKQQAHEYSADKIIDFTNADSLGEVMRKNELLRNIQQDLMVSGKDNILCLPQSQEDTPEMRALKGAINSKQIDKKQYEDRFPQYQNNMRLLKGHSITLSKMIEICTGFDIACELTLKDKPDAVNPMNTEISLDLTEGRPLKKE